MRQDLVRALRERARAIARLNTGCLPPSFIQLRVGVVEGEFKTLRLERRHVLLPLTCPPLEPLGVSDGIEGGHGIIHKRVQRDELLCHLQHVHSRPP
jgi:hypothetical protein